MKTRNNMPLFVVETTDIEHLRDEQIDQLRCGDYLVKKTGNMKHAYKVTYKEDKHGICLSYFACGYSETISYDYVGGHWVFNSKDVSLTNNMEEIVDGDGHNRFIEGSVTLTQPVEGVTLDYGKWSLSGTHLMIVMAFSIENGTALGWQGHLCDVNDLPTWVYDKLVPLFGSVYLDSKNIVMFNDDTSTQSTTMYIRKDAGKIFTSMSGVTLTKARSGRITFDFLIDN